VQAEKLLEHGLTWFSLLHISEQSVLLKARGCAWPQREKSGEETGQKWTSWKASV